MPELPPADDVIRIQPYGLRKLEFVDPEKMDRIVTVTCDAIQLAEAFYVIDEAFPLIPGDAESIGRRRDACRAAVEQLLNSEDNPLPKLTDDQVFQVRIAAYVMAADIKKKMGIADEPEKPPKDSGPTNSSIES